MTQAKIKKILRPMSKKHELNLWQTTLPSFDKTMRKNIGQKFQFTVE